MSPAFNEKRVEIERGVSRVTLVEHVFLRLYTIFAIPIDDARGAVIELLVKDYRREVCPVLAKAWPISGDLQPLIANSPK